MWVRTPKPLSLLRGTVCTNTDGREEKRCLLKQTRKFSKSQHRSNHVKDVVSWFCRHGMLDHNLQPTDLALASRQTQLVPQHYLYLSACSLFGLTYLGSCMLALLTSKDTVKMYLRKDTGLPGRSSDTLFNSTGCCNYMGLACKMLTLTRHYSTRERQQFCSYRNISLDAVRKVTHVALEYEKNFKASGYNFTIPESLIRRLCREILEVRMLMMSL